jgi:A/G-specific adenine glycosylase
MRRLQGSLATNEKLWIDIKRVDSLRQSLMKWYQQQHRTLPWRKTKNPYAIWVSEVMLQQTQVNTVIPYYEKFLSRFPNVNSLARADQQDVLKAWEGLGYYGRARHLHQAAKIIVADHSGKLPNTWHLFRQLPGVGDYIAAAVLSIALNQVYPVVDGNVKRVLSRLFQIDKPVNKSSSYKHFYAVMKELIDPERPGVFNQSVMELGALVCKIRQPLCSQCPLQGYCRSHRTATVIDFPKRERSRPTPEYRIAVGVVVKNGKILITRRQPRGLLGGLWEFPGGKIKAGETSESACIRELKEEINVTVNIASFLTRVKHAYTHFKIDVDVFICNYISGSVKLNGPADFKWVTLDQLDRFPFPKANHKFIPMLHQALAEQVDDRKRII